MQSTGQQLPCHQSLQTDTSKPPSLDLEANKVSSPSTQADTKAKIAEIDKRLGQWDFVCFMVYLKVCYWAGAIFVIHSFIHSSLNGGAKSTPLWWVKLLLLWFIWQYATEGFAILKQNIVAAAVAVVMFVINSLLLIASVVIFGMAYHYAITHQLPEADEEVNEIVDRILRDALIVSVVMLAVQILVNLPVSIKVFIMLKKRTSLEAQLTTPQIKQSRV